MRARGGCDGTWCHFTHSRQVEADARRQKPGVSQEGVQALQEKPIPVLQDKPRDDDVSDLKERLRAEKQESAALAAKLETKDAELKWLQHKYFTTKALHVQELEVVAQRMLLLQAS